MKNRNVEKKKTEQAKRMNYNMDLSEEKRPDKIF
jgi:hypothetical protein